MIFQTGCESFNFCFSCCLLFKKQNKTKQNSSLKHRHNGSSQKVQCQQFFEGLQEVQRHGDAVHWRVVSLPGCCSCSARRQPGFVFEMVLGGVFLVDFDFY